MATHSMREQLCGCYKMITNNNAVLVLPQQDNWILGANRGGNYATVSWIWLTWLSDRILPQENFSLMSGEKSALKLSLYPRQRQIIQQDWERLKWDSGMFAGSDGIRGGCYTTQASQSAHPDCSSDLCAPQWSNNKRWECVKYCVFLYILSIFINKKKKICRYPVLLKNHYFPIWSCCNFIFKCYLSALINL